MSKSLNQIKLTIYTAAQLLKSAMQNSSFLKAISSGYLLISAAILAQITLVPLYLDAFGQYQFGVLMVLLSLVSFSAIGIGWLSSGSLRLLGEYAALRDESEFCRAFRLIKIIYIGYGIFTAVVIGIMAICFDKMLFSGGSEADVSAARLALLMLGGHLVLNFSAGADRLALTAQKRQGGANMAQFSGIVASAVGTVIWLFCGGNMPGVIIFQILGPIVSIFFTRRFLKQQLPSLSMHLPTSKDIDLLKRLGGRTGVGFFLHAVLVNALLSDTMLVSVLGGAKAVTEFYLVFKIAEALVLLIWKIPESLAPYFVQMDARGEQEALTRVTRFGYVAVGMVSLTVGVIYALFGPQLVVFWVGEAQAPTDPLTYALAGGSIFWLGISRLPIILASARLALRQLNIAAGIELLGKLFVAVLLFPHLGYMAVLVAINLVHGLGVCILYLRLLRPDHNISIHNELKQIK
jgi:O-antigen/teichoic acid export membrane protein